jgi:hypothetical protein
MIISTKHLMHFKNEKRKKQGWFYKLKLAMKELFD